MDSHTRWRRDQGTPTRGGGGTWGPPHEVEEGPGDPHTRWRWDQWNPTRGGGATYGAPHEVEVPPPHEEEV